MKGINSFSSSAVSVILIPVSKTASRACPVTYCILFLYKPSICHWVLNMWSPDEPCTGKPWHQPELKFKSSREHLINSQHQDLEAPKPVSQNESSTNVFHLCGAMPNCVEHKLLLLHWALHICCQVQCGEHRAHLAVAELQKGIATP